jgi:hypothetical protein
MCINRFNSHHVTVLCHRIFEDGYEMSFQAKHRNFFQSVRALLLCMALSPLIAACTPSVDILLRVTLAIEADGVVYRGSGIQRIVCYDSIDELRGMSMGGCTPFGESIVTVVGEGGDRGVVFLTVALDHTTTITRGRATSSDPNKWTVPMAPEADMPQLVKFRNMADVRTLQFIDPNDMAATIGTGVKFHSITVEQIQSGEITRGEVIKYLPWLEPLRAENKPFDMKYDELIGTSIGSLRPSLFLGYK